MVVWGVDSWEWETPPGVCLIGSRNTEGMVSAGNVLEDLKNLLFFINGIHTLARNNIRFYGRHIHYGVVSCPSRGSRFVPGIRTATES